MQEPYQKGLANHLDPQSCAGDRKVPGEALTGAHTGQPLSSEITTSACRPCPDKGKATPEVPLSEGLPGAAESKTLGMCGNSMRENRETPATPAADGAAGRSEKASGRTADMHDAGESDDLVVPPKQTNNAGPLAAAESVEGRGSAKGNAPTAGRAPDSEPDQRVVRLAEVRQTAQCLLVITQGKSRMR